MTDYLNPHQISANYPVVNRAGEIQTGRIDNPPGFDSRGIKPMEYKSARIAEDDLPVGATVRESLTTQMTREDAIFFLNGLRSANNCDETIDMAIAALSEPVLDENGLARCGCGGKAQLQGLQTNPQGYQFACSVCKTTTRMAIGGIENAVAIWNTAMGVKGADE